MLSPSPLDGARVGGRGSCACRCCRSGSMPLKRLFNQCLLRPADLKPSREDLEVIGTFNPGAVATDAGIVLLVRVAEQAAERRPDQTGLPRWDVESKRVLIDWEHHHHVTTVDIRVVKRRRDNL